MRRIARNCFFKNLNNEYNSFLLVSGDKLHFYAGFCLSDTYKASDKNLNAKNWIVENDQCCIVITKKKTDIRSILPNL